MMMSSKSLGRFQSTASADGELICRSGGGWRCTDLASSDLHVLFANHVDDVGGRQPSLPQFFWIQPDPHAVVAGAEDLHFANPVQRGSIRL